MKLLNKIKNTARLLQRQLQGLSFRTGVIVLGLCIPFYVISFAQALLPISVGAKGILWTIFFGLAKAFQWSGITILGVDGLKRVKAYFKRNGKGSSDIANTVRLIILDFDGTIGDSQKLIVDTLQNTLKKMGLPERSREQCAATIGLPLAKCFSTLVDIDDEMAEKCADTYREIFASLNVKGAVTPFEGVVETVKELHNKGYILSIASSRDRSSLKRYIDDFGLNKSIALILGMNDTERHKPEPDPVLHTLAHFNVPAGEAVVVGDTEFDIQMGNRAGVKTIGVDYGNGTRRELEAAKADYIISSFSAIKDIISA